VKFVCAKTLDDVDQALFPDKLEAELNYPLLSIDTDFAFNFVEQK